MHTFKYAALIFCILLTDLASAHVKTQKRCSALLLEHKAPQTSATKSDFDATNDFIAYLSRLLEMQILKEAELEAFVKNLEKGTLENPIHEEQGWVSATHLIHREAIQEYFKNTQINEKRIL